MLSQDFITQTRALPGVDAEALLAALDTPPAVSVKLNRRKLSDPESLGYGALSAVPWCGSGFYLDERPKFTLNPLLHAGAFYVQDASSMIHETLVATIAARYGLPSAPLVLDLCAAPGGKTTSMINALPDGAFVVANEVMPQRAKILRENLIKWGYPDIMVTNSQAPRLAAAGAVFDIVAVDAPCSGEGMIRKDEEARSQWSPGLVRSCAALQREILDSAVEALRPGGFLIYSTCTFNTEENERNAEWLVSEKGLEPVDPALPAEWGVPGQVGSDVPALRFMPHLTRGEGLFAALLRKPGDSPSPNRDRVLATLRKSARVVLDGIPQFNMRGKIEIPASERTLSTAFRRDEFPEVALDLDTALRYLRHEAINLPPDTPRGFVTVTYMGLPLGLVKNIGNRANNLYPAEWRIRNL